MQDALKWEPISFLWYEIRGILPSTAVLTVSFMLAACNPAVCWPSGRFDGTVFRMGSLDVESPVCWNRRNEMLERYAWVSENLLNGDYFHFYILQMRNNGVLTVQRKFINTPSLGSVLSEATSCVCNAIDALTCFACSIFGTIADAPLLHFSMNLCFMWSKRKRKKKIEVRNRAHENWSKMMARIKSTMSWEYKLDIQQPQFEYGMSKFLEDSTWITVSSKLSRIYRYYKRINIHNLKMWQFSLKIAREFPFTRFIHSKWNF